MEAPLPNETQLQEPVMPDTTHPSQKKRILIIAIILFLIISIPLAALYSTSKSPKKVQQKTLVKQVMPVNYDNIVISSDERSLFITDLLSKQTTSIDMQLYTPFEVPYGQLTQYNNILSPDKKSALFLKEHNIWKIDLPTKKVTKLTTIGRTGKGTVWNIDAEFPTWSPNGSSIYYSVNADPPDNINSYPGMQTPPDIHEGTWVMSADGKQQKYLPSVINPRGWMPDNKTIIFTDQPYETSDTKSYNTETDTTTIFVKNIRIGNIQWDTDGTKGLYTKSDLTASYLIDNQGNVMETLPHYETSPSQIIFTTFLLSPDGQYILFTKNNDSSPAVLLFNTLTREKSILPITFSQNTKPFWSQDSTHVIYAKKTTKEGDIFIYDLITRKEQKITNTSTINISNIDY